jgi:hypothetical protein
MVINYLNFESIGFIPLEDDSPLVVDSDAVIIRPISLEFLKTVGGRYSQVIQMLCVVDHPEFSPRHNLDIRWQFFGMNAIPNFFGLPCAKRTNHASVSRY